jgi:UDP-N-acetylmuramoylalanine--D-glutamate ligase
LAPRNASADRIAVQVQDVRNKRVTVAGLGRFGGNIAAARWLVENGARVVVTDQAPAEKLTDSVAQLDGLPIDYHLGGQREEDFRDTDLVVASPAIALSSAALRAARDAGVPVTTEIRLFVERCPATVVGITGTKGKSTTTAMLGEILRGGGLTAHVGGNLGGSLLPKLTEIDKTHLVVLELSSFMLEHLGAMRWSPHIAVVTFVAADHLDWHGSLEAYLDAKRNVVRFQRPDDFAVLCRENAAAMEFGGHTKGKVVPFGVAGQRSFELLVPGRHNQLNAQGAFAAASLLGVGWEAAQAALENFRGLPHRLELVHESAEGVRYYNDSIATIPEAAIAALESFPPKRVIQIVGGYDKGLPLTPLSNALLERAKAVLCIGDTGKKLVEILGQPAMQGAAEVYDCGDLATAMRMVKTAASSGDVVLLSTGCASYDQFANFQERGDAFTRLARA